jgi:sarcosine oxidase subunit alpha
MNASNRIAGKGKLSPAKLISFTFDGRTLTALEGDTLASALLANGIHLVGRSFKYHRPRGILSSGSEEPNALMDISRDKARTQPNVRATVQEVFEGLKAKSQNRWPSLEFDIGSINNSLSRFFPAGFYYKTFKWPQSAWDKVYEPIIRKAAGLGVSPQEADTDSYANRFAHCQILVIGSGAAGLTAAMVAAKTGKQVILCDENPEFGGSLLSETKTLIDGMSATEWVSQTLEELRSLNNVTLLNRTTAFGFYAQNMVTLNERVSDHLPAPAAGLPRERMWQIRADQVILASGAIERQIVFPDNDRPGIMLASAAREYLNQYGVTPGRNIGVYTACDSAWAAAFDLKESGIGIPIIVDSRTDINSDLLERANDLDIKVLKAHKVSATSGRLRVKSIQVEGISGGARQHFDVDCLLMSGGWTPSVHLFSQSRGKLKFDEANGRFIPDVYTQDCVSVGSCNGTDNLAEAISEASAAAGKEINLEIEYSPSMDGHLIGQPGKVNPDDHSASFIDFQNDVKATDIRLAVQEGMHSIEHVKRYTTTGMASDQGKMSNMHGLAIAAQALGKDIPQVGLTTFRSPYTPVTFGSIANHSRGELFDPTRRTAIHSWAKKEGAVFEDVGNWKRAWFFPKAGEDMHTAVDRECKTTRQLAGIFDASTLGKIEAVGPDVVMASCVVKTATFMMMALLQDWQKIAFTLRLQPAVHHVSSI